ncbi:MAG TPA: hypothetical protein VLF66_14375, partial [Thermoanaerobaculia bacterium]|nr:hypothetical protein [Thermoanaerobaculia bacterium]
MTDRSPSGTGAPRPAPEAAAAEPPSREAEPAAGDRARSFDQVLDGELEAIRLLRERRGRRQAPFRGRTAAERAHDANLV